MRPTHAASYAFETGEMYLAALVARLAEDGLEPDEIYGLGAQVAVAGNALEIYRRQHVQSFSHIAELAARSHSGVEYTAAVNKFEYVVMAAVKGHRDALLQSRQARPAAYLCDLVGAKLALAALRVCPLIPVTGFREWIAANSVQYLSGLNALSQPA